MRPRFAQPSLAAILVLGVAPSVLLSQTQSLPVELSSFGAKPNDPSLNTRDALQKALTALAAKGGGTLHIAAGQYYVDFPDIASDVDPKTPAGQAIKRQKNLSSSKLVIIPRNAQIVGDTGPGGTPTTLIHWKASGFPIISVVNADRAAIRNISFVYDGLQPQYFPWAQEDVLEAVGVHSRWLGGPYNSSTVIYEVGSDQVRLENLTFTSATADNQHTFAFGIVAVGKAPVPIPSKSAIASLPIGGKTPGGGLSACATGNVFRNLTFSRFVMGILATAQCNPVFENISGDYRGSWYRSLDPTHETGGKIQAIGPPGHLLYLSFQDDADILRSAAHPEGERVLDHPIRNTNVTIRNITEGPDTFSNHNSLGTLALKSIDGGVVENVRSGHPSGLIQTMIDVHNLALRNLEWSSDRDLCTEADSRQNCNTVAIGIVPGEPADPQVQTTDHVTFSNTTLKSPRRAAMFQIASSRSGAPMSHDIDVNGLTIECSPAVQAGQGSASAIVMVRAVDTHLMNVSYSPVLPSGAPASSAFDLVSRIDQGSKNVSVDITIHRPPGPPDNPAVYKSLVQDHLPNDELAGKDGSRITFHFAK